MQTSFPLSIHKKCNTIRSRFKVRIQPTKERTQIAMQKSNIKTHRYLLDQNGHKQDQNGRTEVIRVPSPLLIHV